MSPSDLALPLEGDDGYRYVFWICDLPDISAEQIPPGIIERFNSLVAIGIHPRVR